MKDIVFFASISIVAMIFDIALFSFIIFHLQFLADSFPFLSFFKEIDILSLDLLKLWFGVFLLKAYFSTAIKKD